MLHSSYSYPREQQEGATKSQSHTMASYEIGSQTISSLTAAPNDILRLTAANHNGQQQLLGGEDIMDGFDHDLNFEGEGSML